MAWKQFEDNTLIKSLEAQLLPRPICASCLVVFLEACDGLVGKILRSRKQDMIPFGSPVCLCDLMTWQLAAIR